MLFMQASSPFDEIADLCERLAPPVAQLLDARIEHHGKIAFDLRAMGSFDNEMPHEVGLDKW
jgi:hypothetical protein